MAESEGDATPKKVAKEAEATKEKKETPKKKAPAKRAPRGKRQQIHHVIRTVSKDNSGSGNSWTIAEIEEHILMYLQNGWYVKATHYMGELPEGYTMLWVLLKDS